VTPPGHPDQRSDAQLVQALNAGDATAFDAIYYRHRDWVVRLARRFTGHDDDALDVLQETFAYVFRKFPGFVLTASMTTFLYPVVKNLSIAARRKRNRLAQLPDDVPPDPPAPQAVDYDKQRQDLSAVLAALPEAQREVLLMRFVDGFSLLEIAEALAVPEGTVKSRLHNAIASLRKDERTVAYFEPG
jgi:RNA polymerase sigma-70 factor (ECF subfamily)